jgi:hypothetical protein
VDLALLQEPAANLLAGTALEQHMVGHDAAVLHLLEEHARGQVSLQLDPQLAGPWGQDDRINQPPEALRRLQAGVVALERGGQSLHPGPGQVGHARVEQRRAAT